MRKNVLSGIAISRDRAVSRRKQGFESPRERQRIRFRFHFPIVFGDVPKTGCGFINIDDRWWLHISSDDTKSHRIDERQVPGFITDVVDSYINIHHPVLCRGDAEQFALWVSSTTGRQLKKNLGILISKITREAVGVDVSPHLFRTAGASTAAVYGGNHPHLASALLDHRDPRVTEEHYNRAMSLSASGGYGIIARLYRPHASGT